MPRVDYAPGTGVPPSSGPTRNPPPYDEAAGPTTPPPQPPPQQPSMLWKGVKFFGVLAIGAGVSWYVQQWLTKRSAANEEEGAEGAGPERNMGMGMGMFPGIPGTQILPLPIPWPTGGGGYFPQQPPMPYPTTAYAQPPKRNKQEEEEPEDDYDPDDPRSIYAKEYMRLDKNYAKRKAREDWERDQAERRGEEVFSEFEEEWS